MWTHSYSSCILISAACEVDIIIDVNTTNLGAGRDSDPR